MGRLAPIASVAPPIIVALVLGGLLGREAVPRADETISQYAGRVVARGSVVVEDLYVKTLLLLPGAAPRATVVGKESASKLAEDAFVDRSTDSPSAEGKKDEHFQNVASTEADMDEQRRISVERYIKASAAAKEDVSLVLPEEPDEVRARMPRVERSGPEMRCGQALSPESILTTRGVELKVRSSPRGGSASQHARTPSSWKYEVAVTNRGQETVQLLTRHWIFIDSNGKLESEVKGPGVRGVTPVLTPGATWSYESGTELPTTYGSMYGSFQFEVLDGARSPGERSFSARVARLALLPRNVKTSKVPCLDEDQEEEGGAEMVPPTGVLAVERVIVGASADFYARKHDQYHFGYRVQINNARDSPVDILRHHWEVVNPDGQRRVIAEGEGLGGTVGEQTHELVAGDAISTQGGLSSPGPIANARGTYRVRVKRAAGLEEIEVSTGVIGLIAEEGVTRVRNFLADPNFT
eukprot:TRINITY_DN61720_c0_g1_i1.p1 TRINITY_DN61720_c0_g1~~TRINITY_DN61720_c0_g1_i1.p1  ORF type:complete len:468 (+),score=88.14 TRINITY_DN61720_c0_g1_i1:30-1433(+)